MKRSDGEQPEFTCQAATLCKISGERVKPLTLDITNAAQIERAFENVEYLDLLINNAGVELHDDLSDRTGVERHLAVNLFGTHGYGWQTKPAYFHLKRRSDRVE